MPNGVMGGGQETIPIATGMVHDDHMTTDTNTLIENVKRRISVKRAMPNPAQRRRIRKLANISQATLANAVGVSQSTIGYWETGERNPSGEHAEIYLRLLLELQAAAA